MTSAAPRVPERSFAALLGTIVLAALALRLGTRLVVGTAGYWQDGYTQYKWLADSMVAGHGYAFPGEPLTAFRVPLYAAFVAATTWGSANPWPLIVAQSVVSAALVAMAGLLARRLYGAVAGLVAAEWCAAYPYFVWHDAALQESGLFAALAALATLLLLGLRDNRRVGLALAAGIVLGLAILTRTTLVPFALLALVWLALPDGRNRARMRLASAALVGAATLATVSPWVVRVHTLTGAYELGTETGQSLYAGASPLIFTDFPQHSIDVSRARIFAAIPTPTAAARDAYSRGNPARQSAWYAAQAKATALRDPVGYTTRALRKLAIAFGPWPAPRHGLIGDLGYAAWWVPLLLLGLAGAWRDRAQWRRNLLFAAHFAAFAAVTALVWAQTAHRAYLDVYLMVLAAPALLAMLPPRWRQRLGG